MATVDEIVREIFESGILARVPELIALDPARLHAQDETGRTLLHEAAWHGDATVAAHLLEAGCAIDPRDVRGSTPLHFACQNGHPAIVALLLDAGADIDAVSPEGTPLRIAASKQWDGHREIAALLVARGATIDLNAALWLEDPDAFRARLDEARDGIQSAPEPARLLCDAVLRGSAFHVAQLLERGAEPNRPHAQVYPLALAVRGVHANPEIVRLLLEAGADPTRKDVLGRTPVDWLGSTTPESVRALLREYGGD